MSELHVVVLAAGKGTRMKSALPKVLHQASGLALIEHVIRTAQALSPASVVVVVGHQADSVRTRFARDRTSGLLFKNRNSAPATPCSKPNPR